MVIKICQMGDTYNAPLTFRISRDNTMITYYDKFPSPLCTLNGTYMDFYIRTDSFHKDYGNFMFSGEIWESYYS